MEEKGKQERMKEKYMRGKKKKHVKAKEVQRSNISLEKGQVEKSVAVSHNAPLKENLEVAKRDEILSKENEAEVCKEKKAMNWYDMILDTRNALDAQKRRMEEAEKEVLENRQIIGILKMEKEALKAELCKANDENEEKALKLSGRIQMLENEKRQMEVTVRERNKKTCEMINRILIEKRALKADKLTVEDESKKKVLELLERVELSEKVKSEMEASVSQFLNEKMTLEAEKRNSNKKVLNLVNRIQVLEKENRELEGTAYQTNKKTSEEIKRILNENMDVKRIMENEYKKKVLELVQNIEVLLKKNSEMEVMVNQVNMEKTEEIEKALNEKRTVEIDYMKKIVELTDRISILERDKQMIEANMKKELVIRVEYVPRPNYDAGLTTPSHMEGKQSASTTDSSNQNSSSSPSPDVGRSINDNENESSSTNACKRKRSTDGEAGLSKRREMLPCEKDSEINTTKPRWKVEEDLLNAFDVDTGLCLKAICSLYRQWKTMDDPVHHKQVVALAEYMISDHPEGRMTRTVAELEQLESKAIGVSVQIAKKYYKQVFEIYKNNEDPLFPST